MTHQSVKKFTGDGKFITSWGGKGDGNGKFMAPEGIAADPFGNIFVSDTANNNIQKFAAADGKFITKWGTEGADDDQFQDPHSVVVY
jgi:DNA-binding beta-propeller fold protein YncE